MQIEISAKQRATQGTGASRRLRRAGKIPGILYGGGKDAVNIELDHKELFLAFRNEAFHSSILNLNLNGKKEQVLLRDYQLHPVRGNIQHIDFQRINASEQIHVKVPFHFINADIAPGVKLAHGVVNHIMTEAVIKCLPKDLPEFINVDLANLQADHSIHLSEIKLPPGVEFVQLAHGDDATVASIPTPRGRAEAAEGDEAVAAK